LLHWAALEGRQGALKHALFSAYFSEGRNPSDRAILIGAAHKAGLDAAAARSVLESDLYTQEVREAEQLWQSRGITGVPPVIIDDRYLISGGQPPEAFEQALRAIVAESD
jgi:predicted DsbA family dithiol-disulfide isomerase